MSGVTGATILVGALRGAGVERLFTLSGNQILPVYEACLDAGIAVTDTRHEAAAAHMADAWARLQGEPGVCLVSAAPGHANAVTAIANAATSESPVLWLSGGADRAGRGRGGFQEFDQLGVAAPVCKAAWRVDDVRELPGLVARAWRLMLEGRPGPVHLTLPGDLLAEGVDNPPPAPAADDFRPRLRTADPALVDRALDRLAGARRPVVLASPAATAAGAGEQLRAFGAATGLPWFELNSPRALNDPALQGLAATLRGADVVLLLAPQDYVVAFAGPGAFAPDATLIQVAPDAAELGRNAPPALGLEGDLGPVLRQLLDGAAERGWDTGTWQGELAAARAAGRARYAEAERSDERPLHPLRLATEVRSLLPPDTVVIEDGGEFCQWARWAFGDWTGPTLLNGKLGMIGPGIPFALAAALARPGTPPVAFVGDGTFGFHGMEFDTAVRHGLPFVAIVGNDAAWAAERHRQLSKYGPGRIVAGDLLPTRYDEVARALGAWGECVREPGELRPALERALASGRPACVNVFIRSVPSPAAF